MAGVCIKLVLDAYFPDFRFIQAGGGKFCENGHKSDASTYKPLTVVVLAPIRIPMCEF